MASASSTSISDARSSLHRRESCDTVCSSRNSSCFLQKRKPSHPLASSIRVLVPRPTGNNAVKQRVSSARLLKLRSLQSQLNDANFHLAELQQENRALKNLQTRQDKALSKYEGTHADLPRLLKAHEEETRTLNAKNKMLKRSLKETTDTLKTREDELLFLREQVKTLQALVKTKNLAERHTLLEQVEDLKLKLKSSEDQVDMLNRKIALETKNFKHKLNEMAVKNKRSARELTTALMELDRIGSVKTEIKLITNKSPRNLEKKGIKLSTGDNSAVGVPLKNAITKSELEPLVTSNDISKVPTNVMSSPSENVKARLSSGSNKDDTDENESIPDVPISKTVKIVSRPNSSKRLDKLIHKAANMKIKDEADQEFSDFCNTALTSVKSCSEMVDQHIENFKSAKSDTQLLLESLRETDTLNSNLRLNNFLVKNFDDDDELASHIWEEEYSFRNSAKSSDKNGNVMKTEIDKVAFENKDKLLATLKAIDNGDDIDDITCLSTSLNGKELLTEVDK